MKTLIKYKKENFYFINLKIISLTVKRNSLILKT